MEVVENVFRLMNPNFLFYWAVILLLLHLFFGYLFPLMKRGKKRGESNAFIGYKTAIVRELLLNDDGEITNIAFQGLTGTDYEVNDSTEEQGHCKFNMYSDANDALSHEQRKGNVFLEVLGFGELEEHELGAHAEKQRVLQVGFIHCSYLHNRLFRCDNAPICLVREKRDDSPYPYYYPYCESCMKNNCDDAKTVVPLDKLYYREMVLDTGETIVITGSGNRSGVDFEPTVISTDSKGDKNG